MKNKQHLHSSSHTSYAVTSASTPIKRKLSTGEKIKNCLSSIFSMKVVLVATFAIQVIIMSAVWLIIVNVIQSQSTLDLAQQIRREVLQRVSKHVFSYMQEPPVLADISSNAFTQGLVSTSDLQGILDYFAIMHKRYTAMVTQYIITVEGDLAGWSHPMVEEGEEFISSAIVTWNGDLFGNRTKINFFEANSNLTVNWDKPVITADYNVTATPYYQQAMKAAACTWSAPYYEPTLPNDIFLTMLCPIYQSMNSSTVVGFSAMDYTLNSIRKYLTNVKIGLSGISFIIDVDGLMLADSIPGSSAFSEQDGVFYRLKVTESTNERVALAGAEILKRAQTDVLTTEQEYEFNLASSSGDQLLVQFEVLRTEQQISWIVVVVVNESDFLGSVYTMRIDTVIIASIFTVISLIVSIIIILLITRPLKSLEKQMNKISKLALEDKDNDSISFSEVKSLEKQFNKMKSALKSFGKYVPIDVVRLLLENGSEAVCELQKVDLSLYFSDIEGFTTLSEQLSPEKLVMFVEKYFSEMTAIILQYEGTIDKYIGDAIFSFYNSPRAVERHAFKAVATAVKCQRKLTELESMWVQANIPVIRSRIGIHTGTCLVGNMGSVQRINYTAIGDNVNLAARLEGLNKFYHTRVLISENVLACDGISAKFLCRPIDKVVVVGKTVPVQIYEAIDFIENCTRDEIGACAVYTKAYEDYLKKKFVDAKDGFIQYQQTKMEMKQEEDFCAELMIKRCNRLIECPPENGWDGVQTAIGK